MIDKSPISKAAVGTYNGAMIEMANAIIDVLNALEDRIGELEERKECSSESISSVRKQPSKAAKKSVPV